MAAEPLYFGVWDYVVFSAMLCVSAGIGVYYACTGGKQSTQREFLVADQSMPTLPVMMSLLASFISAITVLAAPAEVYSNGTMFWFFAVSGSFSMVLVARLFVPTFYNLGLTSTYEYLEIRFSKTVRLICTVLFVVNMLVYMGLVLYTPSLALNAVTGLTLWGAVLGMGLVCTFYTALGGMKAVMWTDTFQVVVMVAGFLAVIIQGTIEAGGPARVWELNRQGQRLEFFNFDPDPRVRHTTWNILVGGTFFRCSMYAVNQAQVQRYLSCPSIKKAQHALYWNIPGLVFFILFAVLSGMVMYARYCDCDPKTMGYISSPDQVPGWSTIFVKSFIRLIQWLKKQQVSLQFQYMLQDISSKETALTMRLTLFYLQMMPYFVMDILGKFPGMPGLFTACVFSGALSTMSSGLNALAAVALDDFAKPCFPNLSDEMYTWISKGLAILFGLLTILMAFIASNLGPVFSAVISLFGMIGGPILGIFVLGMMFPCANRWGGLFGLLFSLFISLWIGMGKVVWPMSGWKPPISVDGCSAELPVNVTANFTTSPAMPTSTARYITTTTPTGPTVDQYYPPESALYELSYVYLGAVATVSCVIMGLLVSFLTGSQDPKEVDPRLIVPFYDSVFCCLPESWLRWLRCGVRHGEGEKAAVDIEMAATGGEPSPNAEGTKTQNGCDGHSPAECENGTSSEPLPNDKETKLQNGCDSHSPTTCENGLKI
ncbi:sodium-coupled monocarboxylate transporter 1-like [Branchiostoma floridae]|uniref:Sodium-coupled monocarboxylate transporter 1-like n=1 Tax=Branchiostoma floridae TaxID=7739 RepID=A0A9J7KIA5_BRAFL|nr:sodium-coupled monocarboxylate transporter 1-like [Branchiostoma floridae]